MKLRTYLLLLFFIACLTGCQEWKYSPGDQRKMRDFLVEQNILRNNLDGTLNEKQTILAMIEWSRLNMSHVENSLDSSEPANDQMLDVMTLIETQRINGFLTIHGCWGATSVVEQLLGSVGIQAIRDTLKALGGSHSRLDFPALGRTTLHMDDVYLTRRTKTGEYDIPNIALLAPKSILNSYDIKAGNGDALPRQHKAALARKYLPAIYMVLRAANFSEGGPPGYPKYGEYPTEEDVKRADQAGIPGKYEITDEATLRALDAEIDRMGGPNKAYMFFRNIFDERSPAIDTKSERGKRKDYIPLPKGIEFQEQE